MKNYLKAEEILKKYGWTIDCKSPYEISNEDGSFASGQAAHYVTNAVMEEFITDTFEELEQTWKELNVKQKQVNRFIANDQ